MSQTSTTARATAHGYPGVCGHGRRRERDGCADCDRLEARHAPAAITERLCEAADDIAQALASADSAHDTVRELTGGWLFDGDLAMTGGAEAALAALTQVMAGLRDVALIIENRQLRGQLTTRRTGP